MVLNKVLMVFVLNFILLFNRALVAENNDKEENLILVIRDFFDHNNLDIVYSNLCWKKYVQTRLGKELHNVSLYFTNKLYESDKKTKFRKSAFLVDLSCPDSKYLLKKQKFSSFDFWILLNNNAKSDINLILPEFSNLPIGRNVYLIQADDTYESYSVYKVYKTLLTDLGKWTKSDGLSIKNHDPGLKNMQKENITILFAVDDKNFTLQLDNDQYTSLKDVTTKFNYILLHHLMLIINAKGIDIFENYSDSLVINHLKRGSFDIGATPIALDSSKIGHLSVLGKTAKIETKFVFRAAPHSYISNVFTLPFDLYVWYSCFGLLFIIFIVSYIVLNWEWKDPVFKRKLKPELCLRNNTADIILMEIGSAAQQGFEVEFQSSSGRIVFICILVSVMFLYTSFSASIVALFQSTSDRLNTFDSLIKSKISVGFEQNVSMDYFTALQHQNNTPDYYGRIKGPVFLSLEDGVKKLQNDFFAFYANIHEVYDYINSWFLESEKCTLREIPFKNTHVDYWLFMKKGLELEDVLRTGMINMNERGIRSREYKRLFPTKPFCDNMDGTFKSVGLLDSYGAFLMMLSGVVLSALIFLLELFWKKQTSNDKITLIRPIEKSELT